MCKTNAGYKVPIFDMYGLHSVIHRLSSASVHLTSLTIADARPPPLQDHHPPPPPTPPPPPPPPPHPHPTHPTPTPTPTPIDHGNVGPWRTRPRITRPWYTLHYNYICKDLLASKNAIVEIVQNLLRNSSRIHSRRCVVPHPCTH